MPGPPSPLSAANRRSCAGGATSYARSPASSGGRSLAWREWTPTARVATAAGASPATRTLHVPRDLQTPLARGSGPPGRDRRMQGCAQRGPAGAAVAGDRSLARRPLIRPLGRSDAPPLKLSATPSAQLRDHLRHVRERVEGRRSLASAAQALADSVYTAFDESLVLVRVFATVPFGQIPREDQPFVRSLMRQRGVERLLPSRRRCCRCSARRGPARSGTTGCSPAGTSASRSPRPGSWTRSP